MLCLAIESSCDETSLCFLETNVQPSNSTVGFYDIINSCRIISQVISSQIDIHAQYGGVIPEIGARQHAEQIHFLFEQIRQEGQVDLSKLQHIFVTNSPGLMSALRVGIEFARSIQFFVEQQYNTKVELATVNHLQGHIASCFLDLGNKDNHKFQDADIFPHLHLLVSGGNTQLRLLKSWTDWQIVGQTLDDAVGEAFDKAGRMAGIAYPAGATLSRIAGSKELSNSLDLPVSMLRSNDCNFSFSGLKTAVRYKIQKSNIVGLELEKPLTEGELAILLGDSSLVDPQLNPKLTFVRQLCQSVNCVIMKQILNKLTMADKLYQPASIGLSGGVSASSSLRNLVIQLAADRPVFLPDKSLAGDNATMIGLSGVTSLTQILLTNATDFA